MLINFYSQEVTLKAGIRLAKHLPLTDPLFMGIGPYSPGLMLIRYRCTVKASV